MFESLFNNIAGLKDLQLYLKRNSNTGLFLLIFQHFKISSLYREIDPIRYPLNNILELLTECDQNGNVYNEMAGFRSASSAYQDPIFGITVGHDLSYFS